MDYMSVFDNYDYADSNNDDAGTNGGEAEADMPVDILGLNDATDALINKSPLLVSTWKELESKGFSVVVTNVAPSHTTGNVIYIYVNGQSPDYLAQAFAHEVGHILRPNAEFELKNSDGIIDIISRDEFIKDRVADEAFANLFQYTVANQMGVQLFSNFKDIFLNYQSDGDKNTAINAISNIILAGYQNEAGVGYLNTFELFWDTQLGPNSIHGKAVADYNKIIIERLEMLDQSNGGGETP